MNETALVIGAGVVGLAIGRALAEAGHAVIVAEAADGIGSGISSRNSEVIHAGLYYPSGSLKALTCVAGRRLLYAFCAARGIPHRRCEKLIVATDNAEAQKIEAIHGQGLANGVEGLTLIDGTDARRLEPSLSAVAAIRSAQTGIVDSHAFMLALQGAIEDRGGMIAFNTPVEAIDRAGEGWSVRFGGRDPGVIDAGIVINAAGLHAWRIAAATDAYPAPRIPKRRFAKGNYFACAGRPAFTRLIYPAPVDGGLGVHLTLDLAGRMKFGPDVAWLDEGQEPDTIDYRVDPGRAGAFVRAVRRYWPSLPEGALAPDYSGVRPKLSGPGVPAADFMVDGPEDHGLSGLVHLFGIESPGLTASLALGELVAAKLTQRSSGAQRAFITDLP
jgi:L-2-hydroxyglutarate oxidase LhgO